MWITAAVEDTDERGNKKRATRNRDEKRGLPQGSPLSPLLSNLYMRRFVLGWKRLGYEQRFGGSIVTYADDLVICCKRGADKAYLGTRPSKKSVSRLITSIHERTAHRTCLLDAEELVQDLNRMLRGWANYFKLGPVSKAYRAVDQYST